MGPLTLRVCGVVTKSEGRWSQLTTYHDERRDSRSGHGLRWLIISIAVLAVIVAIVLLLTYTGGGSGGGGGGGY